MRNVHSRSWCVTPSNDRPNQRNLYKNVALTKVILSSAIGGPLQEAGTADLVTNRRYRVQQQQQQRRYFLLREFGL